MSATDDEPPRNNPRAAADLNADAHEPTADSQSLAASLLRSAKLDQPSDAARESALRSGLEALRPNAAGAAGTARPRSRAGATMAAALALVAAVALYARSQRGSGPDHDPELRAETPAQSASGKTSAQLAEARTSHSSPAPPPTAKKPCPEVVVASGSAPLIDDWEHSGAALLRNDGRAGAWLTFDDGTAKQNFPNGAQLIAATVQGGRSRHALHLRGGRFTDWGVVFGSDFANGACYDASAYAGIEFWAKGPARILVGVQIIDIQSPKFGGFCEKDNCYNSHRKTIELDRTWKRYDVRWEELEQKRPEGIVPFDVRRMRFLEFAVWKEDTPFDIWLDDVSFIKRE